jgi:flavin-dependent dehydrogenase
MNSAVDVVVIGGGPAGTAAAIHAAQRGLSVVLLERLRFPRHRPGETLHPGVATILRQLGVLESVARSSGLRHDAVVVDYAGERSRTVFTAADGTRASGYQILRENLDAILLKQARRYGVEVLQPSPRVQPVLDDGRVVGATGSGIGLEARFLVDATGSHAWLSRRLGLQREVASPPLRAYYGYCGTDPSDALNDPVFVGDSRGWTWTAQISPSLKQWTSLTFRGNSRPNLPDSIERRLVAPPRGADVTWRRTLASAGPGYFIVGDAAVTLDPSSSHGVLRALMSGIMAAHTVQGVTTGTVQESEAGEGYRRWLASWFEHDAQRMRILYRRLGFAA